MYFFMFTLYIKIFALEFFSGTPSSVPVGHVPSDSVLSPALESQNSSFFNDPSPGSTSYVSSKPSPTTTTLQKISTMSDSGSSSGDSNVSGTPELCYSVSLIVLSFSIFCLLKLK